MIAKTFDAVQEPVVLHEDLKTTFTGIVHPISTPDAPVHQYRGIKYASVPARFRQSKLCTHYPPQTDCSRFGPICPQPKFKSIEEELFNLTEDCIPDQALRQCEFECLNLNITCPADATPASQYPVMIWIHGGANRGSGSNWITDAGPLVQKSITSGLPVVIVSINYRLGLLGFAASPALRDDNKSAGDEGVGNYGLRDQRRAMEWVHRYIHAFGGDPTNVTLFGESTGAGDILCHLHSAANEVAPLFHRTIIQSAIVDLEVPNVHQTGWQMSKLVSPLRVQTIDELRAVDPEKLIAFAPAFRATDDGVFFRKSWTGSLVNVDETAHHQHSGDSVVVELNHHSHHLKIAPHLVHDKSRSHSRTRHSNPASHQPVIIGDCGAESLLWSLPASLWTAAGAVKRIRAICQSLNKANVLLRLYDINAYTPADELPDRLLELINDTRFAWPTDLIAASLRAERGGHGVWRYVFDQESPSRGLPHHAVDLMYIFDNVPLPSLPTLSPYDCTEPREDGFFFTPDSDDECAIAAAAKKAAAQACAIADDSDSEDDGAPGYDYDADWAMPVVDDWTYARVRNGIQERWLTFAHGRAPWRAEGVYVFGPEGEVGERSLSIFQARRRARVWREALEPLGMEVVQKLGVELCNGPPVDSRSYY